jgi:hypothetical protein
VFDSVVTSRGPKVSEAYVAIETGTFKWVTMKETGKVQPVNCGEFFEVLPTIFKVD